ncbi:plasmid stabilization protein [Pueribacillus theae]|uniref:Plasmid stabilization protein n=1 Tax=Pueribacillus theae TaxID=2171751 RepID=A0A2U1JT92_9BACI|nr:plasmid stabilization protein [Pueribacillus theae]
MPPIAYLNPAKKYFKKLKDRALKKKFFDAIQKIRLNPYAGQLKTGDLAGIYCYDFYYNGTNYEIAYIIEEKENGEIIVVVLAGTRETFYEDLKRYMN